MDMNTQMFKAIKSKNYDEVKKLIENGANVHSLGYGGIPTLIYAVQKNQLAICKMLIDAGVDINETFRFDDGDYDCMFDNYEDHTNALIEAARKGYKDICELLIENGININHANFGGDNALMVAAEKGHKDICELLIEKGIDIHYKSYRGKNALISAAYGNSKEICEMLIEYGVDIHAVYYFEDMGEYASPYNDFITDAFSIAKKKNNEHLCKLLIDNGYKIRKIRDKKVKNYEDDEDDCFIDPCYDDLYYQDEDEENEEILVKIFLGKL